MDLQRRLSMNLLTNAQMWILLCAILCLSGCASSSEWTRADTRWEIAFQVINIADAYTTMQIRHTAGIEEKNWLTRELIGAQPVEQDVALLFAAYGIGHYLISRSLPERWRRYYQVGTLAFSLAYVSNNCRLGLCK